MSEALLVVIISSVFTIVINVVGYWANRRMTSAKAKADSADAAESLSMTAKNITETQSKEIILPLREHVERLKEQLSVMEEDRHKEMDQRNVEREQLRESIKNLEARDREQIGMIGQLQGQINFLIGELRRADNALEHLALATQNTYPAVVDEAIKIRRGQL